MFLQWKRIDENAHVPTRAHETDAGYDLYASESCVIEPGEIRMVGCGFAMVIPAGHGGFVLPRSGLAAKHGVTVINAPGLIDSGYRGEVKVALVNHGAKAHEIAVGDRIAQLVVQAVAAVVFEEVDELPSSDRGVGGFASTGLTKTIEMSRTLSLKGDS